MNLLKHFEKVKELRITEFVLVGVIGATVQLSILYILTEIVRLQPFFSNAIGIEASILTMLYLNNRFTFSDTLFRGRNIFESIIRTNIVRLSGTAVNLSVFYVLTEFFILHYMVSAVVGIGAGFAFNYIGEQRITWKR